MTLYHGTTKRRLGSIMRWGLRPRLPHEHNWRGMSNQPEAVYVERSSHEAKMWAKRALRGRVGDEPRVLRLDWDGDTVPDPLVDTARMIKVVVPPECIEVLS